MADPIWFWQDIVSPHMAGLAAALAARGLDVTYVAEQPMSADRATQGWQVPDTGGVRLLFAPDAEAAKALIADAPTNSVHICQGFRANGVVGIAQTALTSRKLRQWVIMETADDTGWKGAVKRLVYRWLIRRFRNRIEGILAVGHATPAWLSALGMPEEGIFPFAYFLPEVNASTLPDREELRKEEPFHFLFVGRLIELKQVDLLLEAQAGLSSEDFILTVIGSGPLENLLRRKSESLMPGRVRWIGRQPQHTISAHMRSADCLVLPSRCDGWGAVVSEALMTGTPAICSDRCGAAGVVRASGCGGVFPTGDAGALATILEGQIAQGRQVFARRVGLADWARCLGAEKGASYLIAILRYRQSGGTKPAPPWVAEIAR